MRAHGRSRKLSRELLSHSPSLLKLCHQQQGHSARSPPPWLHFRASLQFLSQQNSSALCPAGCLICAAVPSQAEGSGEISLGCAGARDSFQELNFKTLQESRSAVEEQEGLGMEGTKGSPRH